ncbi:hypothetical protein ACTWLT_29100 [Micromonospora sp. ZYX-F-536]|uniref:hypothetical protein n=1 Tax=Micromonospora sp. ZYX-F-536 TaxID=3457629 RepID=UPI0040407CE4
MDTPSFTAIFGPPPANAVPVEWDVVEAWLGLPLPGDYKSLVSTYGPLDIGEFIWLHSPCVQKDRFDYGNWLQEIHRHCRVASRQVPPYEPPAFHPADAGLLAWGETRSASRLFWDTAASDDPDQWPVVIFHQDAVHHGVNPWHSYEMPLLDTLAAAVHTGLLLPGGGRIGPLPATARRTAFLTDAGSWSPPTPRPEVVPEALRRAALTQGTGLAALSLLVPPPEAPYLGGGTWTDLFEELGTRLPDEYVSLIDRYGAGNWCKWLNFVTPLRTNGRGFAYHAAQVLDGYRELRAAFPEYHPLPVWPEPGGFLPFASSIDGDQLGWLTEGDPDQWPLIVSPRHADQGPPLPNNLTDTLLEWVRGRFATEGLPGLDALDDPLAFIDFESWDDEAYW